MFNLISFTSIVLLLQIVWADESGLPSQSQSQDDSSENPTQQLANQSLPSILSETPSNSKVDPSNPDHYSDPLLMWTPPDPTKAPSDLSKSSRSIPTNNHPIIGVLAQRFHTNEYVHVDKICDFGPINRRTTFIYSEIIRFLESGGARVVPIYANRNRAYFRRMFKSVNGIFFPGGTVNLHNSGYTRASSILYEMAVKENDKGIYFPLWGECLGFQFLLYEGAGLHHTRKTRCDKLDYQVNLNFTSYAKTSRLFSNAPPTVLHTLATKNSTYHNHIYCIKLDSFQRFKFDQVYRPLSLNFDPNTTTLFVSSVEAEKYPFYGIAFHPESVFRWSIDANLDHTSEGIEVTQYFARFLVDEARKNSHNFYDEEEEENQVIDNYQAMCRNDIYLFTGDKGNATNSTNSTVG